MPDGELTEWGGSLHLSFRVLPEPTDHLRVFLGAEGLTPDEVLRRMPYDVARAIARGGGGTGVPDAKRYRDCKQVYQTAGLLYEEEGRVHVTDLGKTLGRWLDLVTPKNSHLLGRHAAFALAACQLRNPMDSGQKYHPSVTVFPFAFIWRAMLRLDRKISSDELNRAIFRVQNESDLSEAIKRIARYRSTGNLDDLGPETLTGDRKNDRIIPWISIASFGYLLIKDKSESPEAGAGYYAIRDQAVEILEQAARIKHRHRNYGSVREYVEFISRTAALPRDMR